MNLHKYFLKKDYWHETAEYGLSHNTAARKFTPQEKTAANLSFLLKTCADYANTYKNIFSFSFFFLSSLQKMLIFNSGECMCVEGSEGLRSEGGV